MSASIKVKGLAELNKALKQYNRDLQKELQAELRMVAQIVADDARSRFASIDERSAAGFRPRLRGFGRVVVEQRIGRTTGLRPDFGSLQMRKALLPSVGANEDNIIAALDGMLDHIGRKEGF